MTEEPLDLAERRLALMKDAAAAMADLPAANRTLDEFERRTGDMAREREWHGAAFARQHLRNHPELETVYHGARFPDRKPGDRPPRGTKTANGQELASRLADANAQLAASRKAHREAEEKAERARIGNAADVVREFIRQMGLTVKA